MTVRTRFAPSPTGYLHVGGARTALFSWAYARHFGGQFILRIEDTDLERSTPEATQAILDGMAWLALNHDEGPFYQTQHFDRYRAVIQHMLDAGTAYYCYTTPEELDAMREAAKARGDKPRYDGTWRPEPGKTLPPVPAGIEPVVRFKNPQDGEVVWHDLVKGEIRIANAELDDLVIARKGGVPTYNFCVVVDDWDMRITHVIRGDDHVNNTPRQINILQALGATIPVYGHVPMIHGSDGQKLSKRHGAVSVMQYAEDGYLPEALNNYLARLGWGHGDDEVFSREQFVSWFDGGNLSSSPSQFDHEKLAWLNNHYIKQADNQRLADLVAPRITALGGTIAGVDGGVDVAAAIALLKDRCANLNELAQQAMLFYGARQAPAELLAQHLTDEIKPALADFAAALQSAEWSVPAIAAALKEVLAKHGLKMPKLAMPVRLLVAGQLQTPSIDAVLHLFGRAEVLQRLQLK
ncbi:glutamate--tRNA ligase [Parvibium lacunae]|uniref:Glutamate--tRNA ligase n=1 Tax=Parvibium lacunae TaxID=1888893 RepID=A0A368L489_9BURK|nr:glutamate--tRNA ligase [Parvibium lacunae]RCS58398.1 glutamate--tRNA ligase [Parvibium lacunae]